VDAGSRQGTEPISPASPLGSDVVSLSSSDNSPLTPQEPGMFTPLALDIASVEHSMCSAASGAPGIIEADSSWSSLDGEYLNWVINDGWFSSQ